MTIFIERDQVWSTSTCDRRLARDREERHPSELLEAVPQKSLDLLLVQFWAAGDPPKGNEAIVMDLEEWHFTNLRLPGRGHWRCLPATSQTALLGVPALGQLVASRTCSARMGREVTAVVGVERPRERSRVVRPLPCAG